jgi:hypothetical protein
MVVITPYDAYPSSVGPVFDVATWSRRKVATMALIALPLGLVLAACAVCFWNPHVLAGHLPKGLKDVPLGILRLHRQHPWLRPVGAGGLGVLGFFFCAVAVASFIDCFTADYYLRVGRGGISLRVAGALDPAKFLLRSKVLELELPWDDVADWRVVQVKQLGSLSRNGGNIGGDLKLRTTDGRKHDISLDVFREPAFIIHSRIQDALEMVPAFFGEPPTDDQPAVASETF